MSFYICHVERVKPLLTAVYVIILKIFLKTLVYIKISHIFTKNLKLIIMITHVVLCKKGNITTPVFHVNEEQAKKNCSVLKSYNKKELLTFDEFINLKGIVLTVNFKKFHSVKGAMKAELKYVSKEYPGDLIYYSNVSELCGVVTFVERLKHK